MLGKILATLINTVKNALEKEVRISSTTYRVLLAIKATLCVLHTSFMQSLIIYKNKVIMNNVTLIRYLTRPSPYQII